MARLFLARCFPSRKIDNMFFVEQEVLLQGRNKDGVEDIAVAALTQLEVLIKELGQLDIGKYILRYTSKKKDTGSVLEVLLEDPEGKDLITSNLGFEVVKGPPPSLEIEPIHFPEFSVFQVPDTFRPFEAKSLQDSCFPFMKIGFCPEEECKKEHVKTKIFVHCWEFSVGNCPRGDNCQWPHMDKETVEKMGKKWFHISCLFSFCEQYMKKGSCDPHSRGMCEKLHLKAPQLLERYDKSIALHLTEEALVLRAKERMTAITEQQNRRSRGRGRGRRGRHRGRRGSRHRK